MPSHVRGQSERRLEPADGTRLVRREAPAFRRRRKTEMVKEIPSSTQSSKSAAKFLSALAGGFLVLTASATSSGAQTYNRAFAVSPERSELEVVNQAGTIKVTAGANPNHIHINPKHTNRAAKVPAPP